MSWQRKELHCSDDSLLPIIILCMYGKLFSVHFQLTYAAKCSFSGFSHQSSLLSNRVLSLEMNWTVLDLQGAQGGLLPYSCSRPCYIDKNWDWRGPGLGPFVVFLCSNCNRILVLSSVFYKVA